MTAESPQPDADFAERLTAFVAEDVAIGDEEVTAETDLLLTGLVDSLGVVRVVGWIERNLATEIDPGDVVLEHFRSVEAMLDYLRSR